MRYWVSRCGGDDEAIVIMTLFQGGLGSFFVMAGCHGGICFLIIMNA